MDLEEQMDRLTAELPRLREYFLRLSSLCPPGDLVRGEGGGGSPHVWVDMEFPEVKQLPDIIKRAYIKFYDEFGEYPTTDTITRQLYNLLYWWPDSLSWEDIHQTVRETRSHKRMRVASGLFILCRAGFAETVDEPLPDSYWPLFWEEKEKYQFRAIKSKYHE